MDRRRRDHERIDKVLASRVAAEDDELTATGGAAMLDRLLTPLKRLGSKRFLREARQKVWHNTLELQDPRLAGPQQYAVRLAAPRGHLKGRPWSGRTRVIAVGGPTQRLATFADRGRGMRFLVVRVTDRLS